MAARGEYRPIARALLNRPDYCALSPEGRLVLLTLKVIMPAVGIGVLPPSAEAAVAGTTGLSADVTAAAFDALQGGGWIERDGPVLWVVEGLADQPALSPKDGKHRKMLAAQVAALPPLGIVQRFKARYAEWFDGEPPAAPPRALPPPRRQPREQVALVADVRPDELALGDRVVAPASVAIVVGPSHGMAWNMAETKERLAKAMSQIAHARQGSVSQRIRRGAVATFVVQYHLENAGFARPRLTHAAVAKAYGRLAENGDDASELLWASDGMCANPHNLGDNDRGKPYLSPELLFRNREKLTLHAESMAGYRNGEEHPALAEIRAALGETGGAASAPRHPADVTATS